MDPSPRKQISWSPVTYVTVGWIYPLLSVGSKKPLTDEDLPLLTTHESASHSAKWLDEFTTEAADYSRSTTKDRSVKKPPSLFYALMPHVLGVFVFNAICSAINIILSMSMSLMVGVITNYLNGVYTGPEAFNNGYALAFVLFGMQTLQMLSYNVSTSLSNLTNVRLGAALTSAAYKKSFRLASSSRSLYPPGKINTLCTSDIKNVKMFIDVVNRAWSMPLQVIITLYLVSTLLKAATATAAAVFIGIGLFLLVVRPKMMAAVKEYMKGQDKRTTLLREFLYGVKVVKYQALEEHVEAKISAARGEQVKALKDYIWRLIELLFILIAQQQLTTPLTLATYGAIGNGNNMDPATVFVAFSLLNGLVGISSSLTGVITGVTQASASYKRIYEFLIAEEADISEFPISLPSSTESDASAILFEDASFTWESSKKVGTEMVAKPSKKEKAEKQETAKVEVTDSDIFKLEGVNLTIKKGSLVAVVGATGSGKSSLLSAITGGMRKTGGQATVFGSVGYCPQDPWIISGSVQDNITLLDESLNDACSDAVNACSLAKDLESLANGLGTQIGEKGINLSGGQKARVALARAIAKNPDVYILDDPLSALDAHVGKEIFNGTISGPLMKDKTVVIATHLLHILPKTDHVLVMDQGKIVQSGSYKDLMNDTAGRLFETMKDYHLDEEPEEKTIIKKTDSVATNKKEEATAEDRQVGNVSYSTYKTYFKACGSSSFIILMVFSVLSVILQAGTELLLSAWTSNFLNFNNQMNYVYIYSAASVSGALLANVISMMTLYMCVKGAIQFHDSALKGIMAAPMSFFDTQPIGRLLNRMTGDVASLDREIGSVLDNLNANGGSAIATTLVLWVIAWQFIPISLVMIGIAVYMYQFYRKTYRELKRLNTIMQSPLAAHISETLTGLPTVLSYRAQNIFIERQMVTMDQSNLATLLFTHAQLWFMLRLRCLAALITLALTLLGVTGVIDRRFISLALASTMSWAAQINASLMLYGSMEAAMVNVERLGYYSNDLPHEAARSLPKDGTLDCWPSTGTIEIKNLEISYENRPDHIVINDISVSIRSGEKIGIVGRTGSGKSTLMDAFFRLMEANKGTIEIDGEDIATLGLKKLRSGIQMIPQNPILFDGTVRSNLDPVGRYSDENIWYALECCGMKDYISTMSEKLESVVTEGGSNLSAGQRQLLCLAKVLLQKSKILIMDEATSSVDAESDLRIQDSMKTHFKDATVISIAHRLNTVAAFDRILVLNHGKVAEFEAPHLLLSRNSLFADMVDATGVANASVIRDIAKDAYLKSN
ncbi:P-loop containing nucleoside triphosphate hydrolase protein [Rhizoclosmatium globosum]|uniref:p-loop containing nucleoside triphosphate hydrolase protein n=1 Tax=Rhizoclosmatium globosum TaxID=329046 RepID=A0A1Y2CUF5_9FUNG|nr:P-loop containing nucleoside triphosphate hydrolase protein [Rhizoclosmatium globosum]|eukprot:ORY50464.1 P-loop containing nucleoside triphosphate hydrolase protein [Rhizoclosmatium globosum]